MFKKKESRSSLIEIKRNSKSQYLKKFTKKNICLWNLECKVDKQMLKIMNKTIEECEKEKISVPFLYRFKSNYNETKGYWTKIKSNAVFQGMQHEFTIFYLYGRKQNKYKKNHILLNSDD